MSKPIQSHHEAIELLQGLVAIPSISHQEAAASRWLVEQMTQLGFTRAYVDEAGNAVGEVGSPDAKHTILLLGHIDTVPGDIPVRIEETSEGALLYGRGSVDAKGPLATFVSATARLGAAWASENNLRIVVVGAVEEEAASSKGARWIRDRFNGVDEPIPTACIIGEPSGWSRVTLGYKGRLLIEIDASQPMAHTAGPDAGVATVAVELWNWVSQFASTINHGKEKAFDQFQPSLRRLHTYSDEQMHDHVEALIGIRLPLDFDVDGFKAALISWTQEKYTIAPALHFSPDLNPEFETEELMAGDPLTFRYRFRGYETAWRSDRNNVLVRSFLSAIRQHAPEVRPSLLSKTGTSDMNVVAPTWRGPIVAYGPGDSSLDHTPHEHLKLDEYWKSIVILEDSLRNLAKELFEG